MGARMERMVGVFDDVNKARKAVDDVIAAGILKKDIVMIVSDDEPTDALPSKNEDVVIHPGSDTTRGQIGGAIGGAAGGFFGSLALYVSGAKDTTTAVLIGFSFGLFMGALIGAFAAKKVPDMLRNFLKSGTKVLTTGAGNYDTQRSMAAGAIGGTFGSMAGVMGSYLIGVTSMWYFVSMGLWAAMASIVFGSLVGAMSGRGLAPWIAGNLEDLVDGEHKVLVAVDCTNKQSRMSTVHDLMWRDGATMVRPA